MNVAHFGLGLAEDADGRKYRLQHPHPRAHAVGDAAIGQKFVSP